MPTYQYRCATCSSVLEQWQSFSDESLTECPDCGGTLRRVFSAVGIIFKGGGWYCKDSRPAPACEKSETPSETPAKCDGCAKEPAGTCAKAES